MWLHRVLEIKVNKSCEFECLVNLSETAAASFCTLTELCMDISACHVLCVCGRHKSFVKAERMSKMMNVLGVHAHQKLQHIEQIVQYDQRLGIRIIAEMVSIDTETDVPKLSQNF